VPQAEEKIACRRYFLVPFGTFLAEGKRRSPVEQDSIGLEVIYWQ